MAVYYGDMRVASDASEMYGFTMPCAKKAENNNFTKENRFAYVTALSGDRSVGQMESSKSVIVTDSKGSVQVPYLDVVQDVARNIDYVPTSSIKKLSSDIENAPEDTSEIPTTRAVKEYFGAVAGDMDYVPTLSVTADKAALSAVNS